jgi:hypothetical protein
LTKIRILKAGKAVREQDGIRLRTFPYPYRAAVAICSDIDDTTPRLFTAVHRLLSCEGDTSYGPGLGLEAADSLFVWSNQERVVGLLDHSDNPTTWAASLATLCQAGWIDSIHALGDFNAVQGFSRRRAESAYRLLGEMGIRLKVWINHGNSDNKQNFYARLGTSFSGDEPGSDFYHHDLAAEYGIRYYWWHELTDLPLSPARPAIPRLYARLCSNSLKNAGKRLLGRSAMRRPTQSHKDVLLPMQLRDGGRIQAFTRYNSHPDGIWTRPGRHTFRYQLTEEFLCRLIRWQGCAVVYTHLGQPAWDGESPLFEPEDLEALLLLKDHAQNGEILVATTLRLLDYLTLRRYLRWEVKEEDGGKVIDLKAIDDPVDGRRVPEEAELRGLAFYCADPRKTSVRLCGTAIRGFVPFKADFSGRRGIHLPWRKLGLPAGGFSL